MKNSTQLFADLDVIDDGARPALWQMQRDSEIIENLAKLEKPLLRLYEWQSPSITYGYFIDPATSLWLDQHAFELARRPTGGGILFHVHDFAFSVAIPKSHPKFSQNVLENYRFINEAVLKAVLALQSEHQFSLEQQKAEGLFPQFCMATPTRYDLLLNGLKIGGAAQRKTREGFLHQGSIFLSPPPWDALKAVLKEGHASIDAMKQASSSLYAHKASDAIRKKLAEEIARALAK